MLNLKHVVVRKTIPEKDRTKPMRNVAVLKKASEDSLLAEQITATPFDNRKLSCRRPSNFNWYAAGLGPRFSPDGTLLKHSLLGDPAIFYQTALAHGDIGLNVVPREIQLQLQTSVMEMQNLNVPIALSCIPEQTSPGSQPSNESHLTNNYSTLTNHPSCEKIDKKFLNREADYLQAKGDTASLENWKLKIGQQKLMQQKLSGLMKRKPNDLLMNSGENAYEIQLTREKLDRVIPLINDGKGSRYMSEFWNQPEYIRNTDSSDICTTLTMKERGIYRPIEFIKCPEVVKKEKVNQSSFKILIKCSKETTHPEATQTIKSEKLTNTLVDSEVNESCVNEPSLYLNGYHLNWQSISSNPPQMSLDIHLTFENENPILQTDYIELLNNGNVLISYEWTRIPQKNHFQIDTKESRVFYFDSKPGIIQPSDITHLPVTLKSSHEGIYKEIWRFDTTPTLQGMSPVYVHFHAISVWPEYHQFCSSLAKDIFIQLEREANYRMVYKMLENLIMNIQPKEHPPSPIPEPNTEEEIFTLSNPNFHYKHHVVQKLKQMYKEIKERENKIHGNNNDTMISNTDNWKYSIPELKKMIYKYPPDMTKPNAAVKREEEISKFYQSVDQLAFPSRSSCMNTSVERYRIGYTLLSQNIANLFDLCSNLRELHGLPELTSYPIKTQKTAKTLNLTNERIPASAVARNITQIKQSDEISMETDDKIPQIDLQLLLDDDQESNELVSFTKTIAPNSKLWKNKACSIVSVTISQLLNDLFTYWDDI
ncbi:MYCBP-associated protein [Schistosoma japonicum]|nr:MYCBP-associated protein [Schistosoma japonicum]